MKALIEYGWSILGIGYTEREAWQDAQKNLPDELKAYHCEDLDDFECITDPQITENFFSLMSPKRSTLTFGTTVTREHTRIGRNSKKKQKHGGYDDEERTAF